MTLAWLRSRRHGQSDDFLDISRGIVCPDQVLYDCAAPLQAFGTGLQRNPRLLRLILSCMEDNNLTALHLKEAPDSSSFWATSVLLKNEILLA